MSLAQLFSVAALNLIGALAPGPDIVLITRVATRSRKHAYFTVAGVLTGALMWCTLTVLGAAAVFTAYPSAAGIIGVIGGLVLIGLGFVMAKTGWRQRGSAALDDPDHVQRSVGTPLSCFRTGLLTNLSNPKIVIFLGSVVAPVLPPEPGVLTSVLIIAALWVPVAVLFPLGATVISTAVVRRALLRAGPMIDMASGLFFCLAGATLAIRGIVGLI